MINSIRQLIKLTTKYPIKEKGLVVDEDLYVPCNELVQQQFSPSHEMQKIAELCLLEEAELDIESSMPLPWHFGLEGHSGDDKCDILVSIPNTPPVVAMACIMVHAILPDGTEVSAANHDYHACLKITQLATAVLNIGKEPSESLLSGCTEQGLLLTSLCIICQVKLFQ
eukprot:13089312-Ditylum_brightwellii.AAC.2